MHLANKSEFKGKRAAAIKKLTSGGESGAGKEVGGGGDGGGGGKTAAAPSLSTTDQDPPEIVMHNPIAIRPPQPVGQWVRKSNGADVWYVHAVTGESVWALPPGGGLAGAVGPAVESPVVVAQPTSTPATVSTQKAATKSSRRDKSSPWVRRSDGTGDVWYVHEKTGESIWALPEGVGYK